MCFCGRNNDEVFMIMCDKCKVWYHGECVGITPEEGENIEEYLCSRCRKVKGKRPLESDLDILLNAVDSIHAEASYKKRKVEMPHADISVYHLSTHKETSSNIVGYVVNNSHPQPTVDNDNMVLITRNDIESGCIFTEWGNYRVKRFEDGSIHLSRDPDIKREDHKEDRRTHSTVPLADYKVK